MQPALHRHVRWVAYPVATTLIYTFKEAQKSYERAIQIMDVNFDKLTKGLNKLQVLIEAEKSHLSESQAQLVDIKVAGELDHFNAEIEKLTALQTTGWKVVYPDEKLSGSLATLIMSFKEICLCLIHKRLNTLRTK